MKISKQIASIDFAAALRSLPPASIAQRCATPHQQERMQVMLEHYGEIAAVVAAFFGWQEKPLIGAPAGALVEAEAGYYIALYSLIFFGWEPLKLAGERDWETVAPLISPYQCRAFPESPGAALKLAIALDFEASMLVALQGGSISVQESRRALRGKASLTPGTYGGEKLEAALPFSGWVVASLKSRLRGRSNLRPYLKDYEEKLKARNRAINRLLKGVRGEKWAGGMRSQN